ncbi:hypothetical protein LZK98_04860 [Sphingomonas cannabina]|nr:hypothetical protein [Sphingomonas cannabina]UIJ46280.1 hypothetical protein LZK98_04860 [Sphingomonas cannabina]
MQPERDVRRQRQVFEHLPHDRSRVVGRAVVQDENLERPGIILPRETGQGIADARSLVVGGDQHCHARIVRNRLEPRFAVKQERRDEEGVHEARHVGDEADRNQREHPTGHRCQIIEPPQR